MMTGDGGGAVRGRQKHRSNRSCKSTLGRGDHSIVAWMGNRVLQFRTQRCTGGDTGAVRGKTQRKMKGGAVVMRS